MSVSDEIAKHIARRQVAADANERLKLRRMEKCKHTWGPPAGRFSECIKCGLVFEEAGEDA